MLLTHTRIDCFPQTRLIWRRTDAKEGKLHVISCQFPVQVLVNAVMLWSVHGLKKKKILKRLRTSALPSCIPAVVSAVLSSLSVRQTHAVSMV